MNILVTGASGQLGTEIQHQSKKSSHTFFFENSKELDITIQEDVKSYIKNHKIDFVINCAAYTAVDKAEEELERANLVNAQGVENLVLALGNSGKMIHISTDYVFDGNAKMPLKETDTTDPINAYGISKSIGEKFFIASNVSGIIIRTSWLYSSFGSNFVKTMMRLGKEKSELQVVSDQIGSPTYARDLANVCLKLVECDFSDKKRVYHYSNSGVTSWFEFAKEIMTIANLDCEVLPIKSEDYKTLAKRPCFSVMDTTRIKEDFNLNIPFWKDSLRECINNCQN
ncbi:dTDP-4-dehydrorhamnose reductase [Tenacibaculum sp. SZ-18]|uniref:dTDP-4-dehydrorhamnose reductase n=1 Tax=Tenacibaculum sp. SZ-18 TaxID=754423 RepID=UPI000C2CFE30|nr:dTDP-4-dehydrorhamnose reductase [Tenacibaculum sp. SZ-18]AUC14178.1 dTDP-4-dehydrorhamnose reductase [Tenacibaculum sp. SZ-18]